MSKNVTPKANATKFEVVVGTETKYSGNSSSEALEIVAELKKQNHEKIKFINHSSECVKEYLKGRYDKNYKIVSGAYSKPAKAEAETETTESN